jgi:hypothetical protein
MRPKLFGSGLGFKGYKMLIFGNLYVIVWIGLHNPLGEAVP